MKAWVWALIALVALLLLNAATTSGFFAIKMVDGHLYGSLVDIFQHAAPVIIVGLGMTLVIATGGVDLSVGAVVAIAGTLAALLIGKGFALATVLTAVLATGLALGLVNGLLVSVGRIQPIVATLILMVAGRGVAQLLSDGQILTFTNPGLVFFGNGHILGLPFALWIVALLLLLMSLFTRGTAFGMFVETVGDNPVAARFTGIDARGVLLTVYTVTGLCAAVAGLVIAGQTNAADANNAGLYLELDAILSVVLGGTALTGGRFTLVGTLLGALVLQTLTTTILTKGVAVELTLVVKAAVVLAVCLIQSPEFRVHVFRKRPA